MTRRLHLVFAILVAAWSIIIGWQILEHVRVRQSARAGLINRAKDISNTLGIVMRSQRRFGGVISKERLETTLLDLVKPGELDAIALLNASGEVVASAGSPIDLQGKAVTTGGEQWSDKHVTLINLVDLGTNLTEETHDTGPTIVLPRRDRSGGPDRPSSMRPGPTPETGMWQGPPPPEGASDRFEFIGPPPPRPAWGGGPRRGFFGRPFWMSEEEYQSLIQKQGVHSFVLALSTQPLLRVYYQDIGSRVVIGILATISVFGFGLAWRNFAKSSELELRLVRASELNSHLREMNLAAAGLAHETRNPLNIIRGLAQMITREQGASPHVREKSREILEETDRVTAQLNEFINYSRPREIRPARLSLDPVIADVARALTYDIEEKSIRLNIAPNLQEIEADEQFLRQALFNLLLNAIQAVDQGGNIDVDAYRRNGSGVVLEIRDDGPGVSPEQLTEIFKPYFTTHQKGTGLGLAVVQQIVLAHGWEIQCLSNQPKGAIFRISHIKLASK